MNIWKLCLLVKVYNRYLKLWEDIVVLIDFIVLVYNRTISQFLLCYLHSVRSTASSSCSPSSCALVISRSYPLWRVEVVVTWRWSIIRGLDCGDCLTILVIYFFPHFGRHSDRIFRQVFASSVHLKKNLQSYVHIVIYLFVYQYISISILFCSCL